MLLEDWKCESKDSRLTSSILNFHCNVQRVRKDKRKSSSNLETKETKWKLAGVLS
jgi:hypothetical protein